ncbi:AraC family transcriptional regulator [Oceanospirillum beijerinckii]|uniref:AraC family transcriptional regulator n=1 Tax=Oceanospirillum beijerinckii TaxID=64976 RepID=UPI000429E69E|nr:AraC family transcriptional regulator [Oceanospirillum beijerinckii]
MKLGDIQVNFLQSLLAAIKSCQLDPWPLFAEFGLGDLLGSHPDRHISIPRYMRLGHGAIQLTGREDIGLLMGRYNQCHHFGLLGYCAQSAETLGQVLSILIQFEKLSSRNSRGHSQIIHKEGMTGFQFYSISPYNHYNRFVVDAVLSGWLQIMLDLAGEKAVKASGGTIEIEFEQPPYSDRYRTLPIPVYFSQASNTLWLPNAFCQLKNPLANPISHKQLLQLCQQQLDQLQQGLNTRQQVAELIAMDLAGKTPTLNDIAQQMQLEPWTLRRRLQQEGITFKQLLDETRNGLATRYVRDTPLALGEISYLMGFSTPEAFQRAFKRWHGIAPGQYRSGRS